MIDYRKNKKWKVYIHTSPSGKYYVGVTKQSITERSGKNGTEYKGCHYFYNAILKYGWENFEHEIIADNLTEIEAFEFEKTLISAIKSNETNIGYNIDSGGLGGNRKLTIKVSQYDLDGNYIKTFKSSAEAGREIGIDRTRITNCCRGKSNTAGGFIWEYFDKKEVKSPIRKTQKTVYQYDKNMNFIKCYESVKCASIQTGIPAVSISKCVTGANNFAYGYKFLYN